METRLLVNIFILLLLHYLRVTNDILINIDELYPDK